MNGRNSRKDKYFSQTQEAVQNDVECVFSILICAVMYCRDQSNYGAEEDISYLVQAFVILQTMIVEAQHDDLNRGLSEFLLLGEP